MREFKIYCPICQVENVIVSEDTLFGGFRLKCISCGLSVYLEDGDVPEKEI